MSPVQCSGCGLVVRDEISGQHCYALNRSFSNDEMKQSWGCHYYLPVVLEDEQPLTPFEHLLLKQDEINRKR